MKPAFYGFAPTPPMGWNSYDTYGDSVTEAEVLDNARYLEAHLSSHGWKYVVIDYRWYDPGANSRDPGERANAELAADYHQLVNADRDATPVRTLAARRNLSQSHIRNQLSTARHRDLLTSGGRGQVVGQLTPKARHILEQGA